MNTLCILRRRVAAIGIVLWALTGLAHAAYPDKPIRMIVPLAAGSAVDVAARIVTAKMAASMGQSIVVENLPGAAGIVGADRVAKAVPDGYTIGGFNDSVMTMVPALQPSMPWDILRDFTPVSLVATVEWGLVVGPNEPYETVAGLIHAATSSPGKINYGSGGIGSPQHIAMALFSAQAAIRMTHVPYKGTTQAALGVAGGEVSAAFQGLATVDPLIRSKRVKLIAVATPARMAQFPNVPTVSEAGLPGFQFNSWFTVMAPAGTPPDVVARLNAAIRNALADPGIREQLTTRGLTPRGSSPEELEALTRIQRTRYAALIKAAAIKPE